MSFLCWTGGILRACPLGGSRLEGLLLDTLHKSHFSVGITASYSGSSGSFCTPLLPSSVNDVLEIKRKEGIFPHGVLCLL